MAGPGNVVGGNQRGSGIIDLRAFDEILTRLTAIENAPRFEVRGSEITWPKIGLGTNEKLPLAEVLFDSAGYWDAVNKRYTPQKAGAYLFLTFAYDILTAVAANKMWELQIKRNGAKITDEAFRALQASITEVGLQAGYGQIAVMNGTTDFVEVYGNTSDPAAGKKAVVLFSGHYIGK